MWIKHILSFFFPPRCAGCGEEGALLCRTCAEKLPRVPLQVTSTTWSLFSYHHSIGERLIHAMKFEGKVGLAKTAGVLLARAIPTMLVVTKENAIIVPIPSSKDERSKRGYDHVLLMAESLAKRTGIECFPALLKVRETQRQVKVETREKRLQNLDGAFAFDTRYDCTGKTVVLIDDVTTTGATLREARRALESSGAEKIFSLTLAH